MAGLLDQLRNRPPGAEIPFDKTGMAGLLSWLGLPGSGSPSVAPDAPDPMAGINGLLDPEQLKRDRRRQMMLLAGAGLASGKNWNEGISQGLLGLAQGRQDVQQDAYRQAALGYQSAAAKREAEKWDYEKAAAERQQAALDKFAGLLDPANQTAPTAPQTGAAGPSGEIATEPLSDMAPAAYEPTIKAAAARYGVPEAGLRELIRRESSFNPNAVGPEIAGKPYRAQGIAQFIPPTAQRFGIDPMDPQESIYAAAQYLAELNAQQGGDWKKSLAAYGGAVSPDKIEAYTAPLLPYFTAQGGAVPQLPGNGAPAAQPASSDPIANLTPRQKFAVQAAIAAGDLGEAAKIVAEAGEAPDTHGNLQFVNGSWQEIPGYKDSGGTTVNVGSDKAFTQYMADELKRGGEAAQNARGIIAKLGIARQATEQYAKTGTLGDFRLGLEKAARALGLKSDAPAGEVIKSVQTQLAVLQRIPGSGATTDFEMDLYLRSVPGVNTTPEGNLALIAIGEKLAKRTLEDWDRYRAYVQQNGSDVGFQFNDKPVLTEAEAQLLFGMDPIGNADPGDIERKYKLEPIQ